MIFLIILDLNTLIWGWAPNPITKETLIFLISNRRNRELANLLKIRWNPSKLDVKIPIKMSAK